MNICEYFTHESPLSIASAKLENAESVNMYVHPQNRNTQFNAIYMTMASVLSVL